MIPTPTLTTPPIQILAWFIEKYEFSAVAILFGCLAVLCSIGSLEAAFLMLAFAFGCAVAAMRERYLDEAESEAAEKEIPALVDQIDAIILGETARLIRVREVTEDLAEAA